MLKPRNITSSSEEPIRTLPLDECLAKTISSDGGSVVKPGINVFLHCLLTGLVAREILRRMPDWLKERLLPDGSEFIVAIHDVGKIWHIFQEKIYRALRTEEYKDGRKLNIANTALERTMGGHSEVSQATIYNKGKYLAEIIGRHHGYSNSRCGLSTDAIYGGPEWQLLREQLIEEIKKRDKLIHDFYSSRGYRLFLEPLNAFYELFVPKKRKK